MNGEFLLEKVHLKSRVFEKLSSFKVNLQIHGVYMHESGFRLYSLTETPHWLQKLVNILCATYAASLLKRPLPTT